MNVLAMYATVGFQEFNDAMAQRLCRLSFELFAEAQYNFKGVGYNTGVSVLSYKVNTAEG